MDKTIAKKIRAIHESDLSELDKLMAVFSSITHQHVEEAEREIDLARAMNDKEKVVKQQIHMETMKYAWSVLETAYTQIKGRRFDDEQSS